MESPRRPLYSKSSNNAAGKIIAGRREPHPGMSFSDAQDIAGNWRSSHAYPLHVAYCGLRDRAKKIYGKAIVAQRWKRLPSVASKLKLKKTMGLSQMQDLGGCRAIVETLYDVRQLVEVYEKKPLKAIKVKWKRDYIAQPRETGYRGVHLVCEYQSPNEKQAVYNGRRVEIQIRSRLQHVWKTSVEIVDTFTGQKLKSGIGRADWDAFFVSLGRVLADFEKPWKKENKQAAYEHAQESRKHLDKLNVVDFMKGVQVALPHTKGRADAGAEAFVIVLDIGKRTISVESFRDEEAASRKYLELEKEHFDDDQVQVLTAGAGAVKNLHRAYPNYYLDTGDLIRRSGQGPEGA